MRHLPSTIVRGGLCAARVRFWALIAPIGAVALVACGARFTSTEAGASGAANSGAGAGGSAGQHPLSGGAGGSNSGGSNSGGSNSGGTSAEGGSAGSPATAGRAGSPSSSAGGGGVLSAGGSSVLGGGGNGGRAGGNAQAGAAGRGGSGGLGGSIGSGGLTGSGGFRPCAPALVIDDMEDGNDRNCPNQGRNGEWWASTGTLTGTIEPPKTGDFPAFPLASDARVNSNYGMRLSGKGFGHEDADWASLGFNLIDNAAYDLTPYQGLSFFGKSKAGAVTVHVEFATNATVATSEGGACQSKCNDHYAKAVTLDNNWQEFSIPFSALSQEGWGIQAKDLAHSRFVFFGFLGTDGGAAAFDFLIDDVRLY